MGGGADSAVQVKGACKVPTASASVRVFRGQVLCSGAGAQAVQVPGSGRRGGGVNLAWFGVFSAKESTLSAVKNWPVWG